MSTLSKIRQRELARMTPHRGRRAVLGYLASVLMLSGVLLLVDVVTTMLWQEPISAALAIRDQDRLDQELQGATGRISRVREDMPSRSTRAELSLLANRYARSTRRGSLIGRISMPSIGGAYVALQGTGSESLRRGPGHYSDTSLPGQGGTVGFAGHRTTFLAPFRRIDELRQGHEIVVSMPYGRFLYRVTGRRVVDPRAVWVINRSAQERLVLTACHPPFSAAKRIVVFAHLRSVQEIEPPWRPEDLLRRLETSLAAWLGSANTGSTDVRGFRASAEATRPVKVLRPTPGGRSARGLSSRDREPLRPTVEARLAPAELPDLSNFMMGRSEARAGR